MRKLLIFVLGFALSCLLYSLNPGWDFLPMLLRLTLLASLGVIWVRRLQRPWAILLLGLSFGLIWCFCFGRFCTQPAEALTGRELELSGEACGNSTPVSGGVSVELRLSDGKTEARVSVYLPGFSESISPGDRVWGSFHLHPIREDSYGDSLLHAYAGGLQLSGVGELDRLEHPARVPLRYLPKRIAGRLCIMLDTAVPKDASGFLRALITGDRSGLSAGVRGDLSAAGVSHVIAISGMHVSILIAFLCMLGNRRVFNLILCIPVLFLFVLMTGGSPSVIRAAVMQLILMLAPLFRREEDVPTSMSAAAFLLLLFDPGLILNVSFLMSFGAVAGIYLLSGPMYRYLMGIPPVKALLDRRHLIGLRGSLFRLLGWLCRFLASGVSVTLGGLLFTTPLVCLLFGAIPVYAVLANVLIVWVIPLCFVGGLLTALIALAVPPAGAFLGGLVAWPVRYVLWVCRCVSRLPYAQLPAASGSGLYFLIFAYVCIGLAVLLREKRYHRPLGLMLAGLLLCIGVMGLKENLRTFTAAALDVGQGQCICIHTPEFTAMVDCGGDGQTASGRHAADYLRRAGIRSLDALVLTHYDTDHINGAVYLLETVPVERLYLPEVEFDSDNRLQIEAAARDAEVPVSWVTEDQSVFFRSGCLQIFAPVSQIDDNAACLSVYCRVEDFDLLVTGDLDALSEYELLRLHTLPEMDLFVAGHHGSADSSGQALLEAIRPKTVFISVGRNRYGHPTREALDRFAEIGARVYRTDESGDLEIGR